MAHILTPIDGPISLERLAYDAIKEAILSFKIKPGENLVESELASQLQISKTPVRDALIWLEKEGFVVRVPYKGTTVSEITHESMKNIFEIRAVLEGLATRAATPMITEDEIDELQLLVKKHGRAVHEGRLDDASRYNRQFHDLIVQKSPNPWLKQILANLDDHLRRYRTLSNFQAGRIGKSADEHQAILDAIIQHDAETADRSMEKHLLSVMEDLDRVAFDDLIRKIIEHEDQQ